MNLTIATTPATIPAPRLHGQALIPADRCQVPGEIEAGDVLAVDFDCTSPDRDGLYLVEAVTADGVGWVGCRRIARTPAGLLVNDGGAWVPLSGLRVAGRVAQVFKPVARCFLL